MPSDLEDKFPLLVQSGYRVTSEATVEYNCYAWAIGKNDLRIDPSGGCFWPEQIPSDGSLDSFSKFFNLHGFVPCETEALESGFEKIALYGNAYGCTHAALQLPSGKWTSKLGYLEDIEHNSLDGLASPEYGVVIRFMKRAKS